LLIPEELLFTIFAESTYSVAVVRYTRPFGVGNVDKFPLYCDVGLIPIYKGFLNNIILSIESIKK
jgi:hypothetical protein